ncbi:MAG: DEAD/DEAH box helicase, partial [Bradymonadaceae bacterium]
GEKPSTGGLRGSPEASESDPAAEIDDVELVTADNDAELAYRSLLDGFSGNESIDGRAPDAFEGELYEHQRDGFAWLSALSAVGDDSERDERGGLLADDTGLGKTIQVIALFARRLEQGELTPSLLVVPKTLMANWEQEIRQFCPEIGPIYRHHGSGRLEQPDRIAKQEVVITTYGTLRADQLLLGKVEFQVMACDEAQRIKNYSTKRAAACRAMDAELKLPLTATPVENELDDLWSILDFCQPGLLGTLPEFREEFADPVEAPDDASERERAARRLRDEVRPHFVRRRKSEVLDDKIPDKRRHRTEVPISERQARAYRRAREAFGGGRGEAFQVIDNLLRICSHPIVTEARDEGVAAAVQTRALDEVPGNEEEIVSESGKLQHVFDQLLPDIRDRGGKALLFTRFRREQLLAQMLVRRYFGFRPDAINGDAAGSQRQRIVDRFCAGEGFDALVLSPRAAGVGLNIQAANHVIHLSREWNPAQEKQAADRVHRIGQDSTVHVHAPVAVFDDGRTSADARLDRLLDEKREMAHAVMAPSGDATVSTSEFDDVY